MKVKNFMLIASMMVLSYSGVSQWLPIQQGNFHSIQFVNADTGFVFGELGALRRTTDGGQNWDSASIFTAGYIEDYAFPSSTVGYAVGGAWFPFPGYYGNSIMKTTDGGLTWDSVYATLSYGEFFSISATSTNEFFATGTIGMLHSDDGGATLDTMTISGLSMGGEAYLRVRFIDPNTGYVLGSAALFGVGHYVNLYKTTDGGQSWQSIYSDTLSLSVAGSDFVMTASGNGMISTGAGTFVSTTDGGISWQSHTHSDSRMVLNKFEEVNGEVYAIYSTLSDTTTGIYHTADWGQSWQDQAKLKTDSGYISDLSITSEGVGYFVTYNKIYKNEHLVSLKEESPAGFQLYPNPATDGVFIRLEDPSPAGITLYDNTGRKVATSSSREGESFRLNINHLSPGIFLLEIRQKGQHFYQKLVKE